MKKTVDTTGLRYEHRAAKGMTAVECQCGEKREHWHANYGGRPQMMLGPPPTYSVGPYVAKDK